jgi:hypothetical protein
LDILLDSSKESESPERYFWWSGLAAIASVVRKNVYLQRGPFYKLYANIFVALVSARSGLRKGIPISTVKYLIESLDSVRVISGCNSIQGMIKELSQQKTFKSGAVVNEAQGLLISGEFESFITEDPRALTYLTALQNTHENEKEWAKNLRNSPLETLKAPCLSLLVASNEALFESMVKMKDIEGGFIARTFIVHESRRRQINPLIYTNEELKTLVDRNNAYTVDLVDRLREMSNLKGEFAFSPGASKLYIEWYNKICAADAEDRTGTYDRLGDQVLKVAMLVSISNHGKLMIDEESLTTAIENCEGCLYGVQAISLEKNVGEINPIIEKVLKVLINSPDRKSTRKALMIKTHIEALQLDRALETLIQRGAIGNPKRNEKKEIYYQMSEEVYNTYMKYKKEIN